MHALHQTRSIVVSFLRRLSPTVEHGRCKHHKLDSTQRAFVYLTFVLLVFCGSAAGCLEGSHQGRQAAAAALALLYFTRPLVVLSRTMHPSVSPLH
jgi:hypothetical protein